MSVCVCFRCLWSWCTMMWSSLSSLSAAGYCLSQTFVLRVSQVGQNFWIKMSLEIGSAMHLPPMVFKLSLKYGRPWMAKHEPSKFTSIRITIQSLVCLIKSDKVAQGKWAIQDTFITCVIHHILFMYFCQYYISVIYSASLYFIFAELRKCAIQETVCVKPPPRANFISFGTFSSSDCREEIHET